MSLQELQEQREREERMRRWADDEKRVRFTE